MLSLIFRRNWAMRLSIVLNVCVLLYVCAHFGAVSGPWIEDTGGSSSWGAGSPPIGDLVPSFGTAPRPNATVQTAAALTGTNQSDTGSKVLVEQQQPPNNRPPPPPLALVATNETKTVISNEILPPAAVAALAPAAAVNVPEVPQPAAEKKIIVPSQANNQTTTQNVKKEQTLQEAINCYDKSTKPKIAQRGDYWVYYNYVPMSTKFHCWESVTYTTHADYTFLDNLEPLLERWAGPISIALHAPGNDLAPTIEAIKYARSCGSPQVAQLVTFHIYFSSKHVPKMIPAGAKVAVGKANCSKPAPWINVSVSRMYKSQHKLLYPVNVGRNVARDASPTHYILASDIELYPSPGLTPKFLEMIRRGEDKALKSPNPKVFVLSIFEVTEKSQPPANKTALMHMLKTGEAIPFHKKLCSGCHNVPRSKEWQEAPESPGLHVFHTGKRIGSFIHWEPIYIGTNEDPLYDERLSWEGKSDKMTQGYALCVMDYDFLIVDNAFLVHRPGIKIYKKDNYRDTLAAKTNILIKKIILPELKVIYGTRKGCAV